MTGAILAQGTLIQMGDGGTPTELFNTIAEVTDAAAPPLQAAFIDVTSHDSPNGYEEVIPGVFSSQDLGIKINWIPTNASHGYSSGLAYVFDNRLLKHFKFVASDGPKTTWRFNAYVGKLQPKANPKQQLMADVTLRVTGRVTLA